MSGPDKRKKLQDNASAWLRFSGIGFQMAVIIGLGAYGGWWADGRTGWEFPAFTLIGSLGGVALAMWVLFRETRVK